MLRSSESTVGFGLAFFCCLFCLVLLLPSHAHTTRSTPHQTSPCSRPGHVSPFVAVLLPLVPAPTKKRRQTLRAIFENVQCVKTRSRLNGK